MPQEVFLRTTTAAAAAAGQPHSLPAGNRDTVLPAAAADTDWDEAAASDRSSPKPAAGGHQACPRSYSQQLNGVEDGIVFEDVGDAHKGQHDSQAQSAAANGGTAAFQRPKHAGSSDGDGRSTVPQRSMMQRHATALLEVEPPASNCL